MWTNRMLPSRPAWFSGCTPDPVRSSAMPKDVRRPTDSPEIGRLQGAAATIAQDLRASGAAWALVGGMLRGSHCPEDSEPGRRTAAAGSSRHPHALASGEAAGPGSGARLVDT